ncbi:hypothetical protein D3C80_1747750 [compost metagenome]
MQGQGEALQLLLPVAEHGGRADDQCRPARRISLRLAARRVSLQLFQVQEIGDQLHGFAEAHIIGQDGSEAEAAEKGQPGIAFMLIAAELGLECGRYSRLRPLGTLAKLADQLNQMLVQLYLQPEAGRLLLSLLGSGFLA